MRERALAFGPDRRLVGVACIPSVESDGPAVLMINSGIVHHVGVGRLHVRLARRLAEMGLPSLRFDLTGIGDSGPPKDGAPLGEIVLQDLAAALGVVRDTFPGRPLVAIGLCSGARDALEAAVRHQDVVGVVAIDLICDFRTWQHHAVHFGSRLHRWRSWWNLLSGRTDRFREISRALWSTDGADFPAGAVPPPDSGPRSLLTRDGLRGMLRRLLERDVRLFFAFSAGLEDNYNHRGQFAEALPDVAAHPGMRVSFFPEADHTFSVRMQQDALSEEILAWTEGVREAMGRRTHLVAHDAEGIDRPR